MNHEEAYRVAGFTPLPVGNDKRPATKNWTDLAPLEDEIDRRRRTYPDANIGLLAGTALANGKCLGFVDVDDPSLVEFVRKVLKTASVAKRGAKGLTYFVQHDARPNKKLRWKGGKELAVELLCAGSQTVLPPSRHPEGMQYAWIGPALLDVDPTMLPVFDDLTFSVIEAVLRNANAKAITDGGAEVHGHDFMLALTSSGIARLTPDHSWLADCLNTLFHTNYKGNTTDETLDMLRSASAKELGSVAGFQPPTSYDPGDDGPRPLGYTRDGLYALLDPVRQIVLLASSNQLLSAQYLIGLAPAAFWQERFPSRKGGFSQAWAGEALIAGCKKKGPFVPENVRGRGIWREGRRIIVNLGGLIESTRFLYLCFEPIALDQEATFDTARLLRLLQSFNWRDPDDAMLLLGWLALAPICGALTWRPHCFVYGPPRSGKTTLHAIAGVLLSPLRISADGQSSEAGIRQTLGPGAMRESG